MGAQKQYVAVWKSGLHIKWRGLTMREYEKYSRMLEIEPEMRVYCEVYDDVIDREECLPIEHMPAGIVDYLGRKLLRDSAFSGDAKLIQAALNKRRESLQTDYFEQAKAVIAGLFRYTFAELDNMDEESFFELLAKAELISGEKFDPTTVKDPKVPDKRPRRPLSSTQAKALERTRNSNRY